MRILFFLFSFSYCQARNVWEFERLSVAWQWKRNRGKKRRKCARKPAWRTTFRPLAAMLAAHFHTEKKKRKERKFFSFLFLHFSVLSFFLCLFLASIMYLWLNVRAWPEKRLQKKEREIESIMLEPRPRISFILLLFHCTWPMADSMTLRVGLNLCGSTYMLVLRLAWPTGNY